MTQLFPCTKESQSIVVQLIFVGYQVMAIGRLPLTNTLTNESKCKSGLGVPSLSNIGCGKNESRFYCLKAKNACAFIKLLRQSLQRSCLKIESRIAVKGAQSLC